MKIETLEAVKQLVDGYQAELKSNGHFVACEYNKIAGENIFVYDDNTDTLVLNEEVLRKVPHYRVEWDIGYWGGDYHGVGNFAYIPAALVYVFGSVEEAFEKFTGNSQAHIINYTTDEEFRSDGTEIIY